MRYRKLQTESKVYIHPSTKIFEGVEKIDEAEKYATEACSYVFNVYERLDKGGAKLIGYGIPK